MSFLKPTKGDREHVAKQEKSKASTTRPHGIRRNRQTRERFHTQHYTLTTLFFFLFLSLSFYIPIDRPVRLERVHAAPGQQCAEERGQTRKQFFTQYYTLRTILSSLEFHTPNTSFSPYTLTTSFLPLVLSPHRSTRSTWTCSCRTWPATCRGAWAN